MYRETVYFESEKCIGGPTFCVQSRGVHHYNTVIQIFCIRIPANLAAIKRSLRENISFV
jgi:small basic protein